MTEPEAADRTAKPLESPWTDLHDAATPWSDAAPLFATTHRSRRAKRLIAIYAVVLVVVGVGSVFLPQLVG